MGKASRPSTHNEVTNIPVSLITKEYRTIRYLNWMLELKEAQICIAKCPSARSWHFPINVCTMHLLLPTKTTRYRQYATMPVPEQ